MAPRPADLRVLITGAGSGIGAATARLFGERHAVVVCLDRDQDAAGAIRAEIEAGGSSALDIRADIADAEQVQSARLAVHRTIGPIDVLVNNAGVNVPGSIADLTAAAWRAAHDVNLTGAFHVTKAFWSDLVASRRGAIVNVSSIMGLAGDRDSIAYCVCKAGIVAMTRCLALDGARHGIRANCVSPGFVTTPPLEEAMAGTGNSLFRERLESELPLRRIADPHEVASAIVWLASDEASYVTGANIVIDGGATLGYRGSSLFVTDR